MYEPDFKNKETELNQDRFAERCALCGGVKRAGTTTLTVDFGYGVFVVRDVPATLCAQCGEEWVSDQSAARVEELVESARQNHAQVEVLAYS